MAKQNMLKKVHLCIVLLGFFFFLTHAPALFASNSYTYVYDSNTHLLQKSSTNQTLLYTYDQNGNLLSRTSNLLKNPGMELGTSSGPESWLNWGNSPSNLFVWDTLTKHNGTAALKIVNPNSSASVWWQAVEGVQAGQEYDIEGWVKTENVLSVNNSHGAMLYVVFKDIHGTALSEHWISPLNGTQEWTKLRGTYVVPRGTEQVEVGVRLWGGSGTVWFDDMRMAPSGNLVQNPGIELATSAGPESWVNWRGSPSNLFVWDTLTKHSGAAALKIVNPDLSASQWSQSIKGFQAGQEYAIQGWIKTEGVSSINEWHGAMLYLIFRNSADEITNEYWLSPHNGDHEWVQIHHTYVVPAGTASVELGGRLWGAAGTVWFDGIRMIATETDGMQ